MCCSRSAFASDMQPPSGGSTLAPAPSPDVLSGASPRVLASSTGHGPYVAVRCCPWSSGRGVMWRQWLLVVLIGVALVGCVADRSWAPAWRDDTQRPVWRRVAPETLPPVPRQPAPEDSNRA